MNTNARPLYILVGVNLALVLVVALLVFQMGSTLNRVNATVHSIEFSTNNAPDYKSQFDRLFREVDTICETVTAGKYVACY